MSIDLIIFDLDGTLVDSSIDIAHAINYALSFYAIKPVTVEETKGLVGEGVTRLIEKLMERNQETADGENKAAHFNKELLMKRFMEHYSTHLVDNTTLYPGVAEVFRQLYDYKKAVISNKRTDLSSAILDRLGLLPYLDLVVGSDATPEKKPSPVPINYVLRKLDVGPGRAVIVGDSNFDIEAGKAAGIKTVAVTYGFRRLDSLKGADLIIDSMPELINVLRRFN